MNPRPIRRLALLGATLLALAACGGSGTEPAPTLPSVSSTVAAAAAPTTTAPEVDPEEAFQEYSECMREHGVEMPDPSRSNGSADGGLVIVGEGDFDISAFEEATEACDPILEDVFGEFEMTPEMEAEMRDQELAFARCMRDNGVEDWPDPSGDLSGGMTIELPDNLDPEQMNAAMELCSTETFGTSGGFVIGGDTP